jgi:DNA polymerase I-like protein with 3'-5' exonuclease and polymerase domains
MDLGDFFVAGQTPQIKKKPWMESKEMILVTPDTLDFIIDECINAKLYALDLETTGLDNRVFDGRTKEQIVGICLSPDGVRGFYIPVRHKNGLEHNIPLSQVDRAMQKLINSEAVAIFHNGKFDQEFLQFNGGTPWGEWDLPKKWEDTMILAYLHNSRSKGLGLKKLAKEHLGMEMIKLSELFDKPALKYDGGDEDDDDEGGYDFSELNPVDLAATVWYATSDAICTYLLYKHFHPLVITPNDGMPGQANIYSIEKLCVASIRWMERARIYTNRKVVTELIQVGQKEWWDSIFEVYKGAKDILGRDVTPGYLRVMAGDYGQQYKFNSQEITPSYMDRVETGRKVSETKMFDSIPSIRKKVPSLIKGESDQEVDFPAVYDILSAQQLGVLMREIGVTGLAVTEKSGQIKTTQDEMERVLDASGDDFPFLKKIKRFRQVAKALSTYLLPLYTDITLVDNSLRVRYNQLGADTGRFTAKGERKDRVKISGGTTFPIHGTPATYDPNLPECLLRIRECIASRPGKFFVSIDFSGVELRIATNLSREPKWENEFFRCSDCSMEFDRGDGRSTPAAPPTFCPRCGSDKIGDLHTLTALSIYGEKAKERPDWKQLRGYGKSTNFALAYGGSGSAVVRSTGVEEAEGKRIKRQFDSAYKVLSGWWEDTKNFARKHLYVMTAFGRRYPLPDIHHEDGGFRSKAERNSVNGPVQGCSADITKISMGLIYKECKKRGWLDKVHMLITMHDELDFEIDGDILPEAIDSFVGIMNRNPLLLGLKWPVPLTSDVEIGLDWTVPWNLHKIRKTGKWPAELKPFFPEANTQAKEETQVIEVKALPEPQGNTTTLLELPQSKSGNTFEYRFPLKLTPGNCDKLASVVHKCAGRGTSVLQVISTDGQYLVEALQNILVNPAQFTILAEEYIK